MELLATMNRFGSTLGGIRADGHLSKRKVEMLSARSYVQDGLIAMWDGIENAGYGVHNPNATVWKNLITMDDELHIPDGASWGDVYLHTQANGGGNHAIGGTGSNHYLSGKLTEYPFCSFECSFLFFAGSESAGNAAGCIGINIAQGSVSSFIYGMPWGVKYYLWPGVGGFENYAYNASDILSKNSLLNICVTCERGGLSKFYINGELKISKIAPTSGAIDTRYLTRFNSGSWNGDNGIDANYYGMRIYNRTISQDEVMSNYAIDKARFGLEG